MVHAFIAMVAVYSFFVILGGIITLVEKIQNKPVDKEVKK